MTKNNDSKNIPIWQKYALTISEAAKYFNIGQKKLYQMAEDYTDSGFVLQNGSRNLIKRELFEKFLDGATAI